ncbi:Uncharacterized protein DBV15_07603 [Temnothorax longispinosus]|uniref:CUB domain-containing protein n=1 Tax=Temnothorax longispinosus TaxID=300112 RepID=A0A4S2KG48_9HYME|nr:Uncharacterized protein DBV15_07603 [Temnothorax longispinosus]
MQKIRCSCVVYSSSDRPQGGTFTSPDYPKRYPPNIDCLLYTFIGHPDEIVFLQFHHFNIRRIWSDCTKGDFLKLFLHLESKGISEYTPWSGVLCGELRDIPQFLYSSRSTLILEFHTEGPSSNSTGFSGTFSFIDRRLFEMDGLLVPGTMCDHEFVSSQSTPQYGRFYSPRYPSSYPKNIRCSYLFRASCLNRADLIRVHDGTDSGAPTIAVLCNQGAEVEVLSTGPGLYVEFVANSEWPGQGFKAMFQFQPLDDALHPEPDKVPGAATGNPKYSVIGPAVSATNNVSRETVNSNGYARPPPPSYGEKPYGRDPGRESAREREREREREKRNGNGSSDLIADEISFLLSRTRIKRFFFSAREDDECYLDSNVVSIIYYTFFRNT